MAERRRKRTAFEPAATLFAGDAQPTAPAKRPLSTALGASFVLMRAIVGVLWLLAFALVWRDIVAEEGWPREVADVGLVIVLVTGGVSVLVLLLLGWLIWRGGNLARVLVMLGLTLSILTAAISYFVNGEEITVQTTLVTVALDILVLLALSSRDARAWARRPRDRRSPRVPVEAAPVGA